MSEKVNFVVIGAQKSGTTSLAYQLSQHPEINFCVHKEPNFFSQSESWPAGIKEYHRLFEFAPGKKCGEASTTYTWFPQYPHTAGRMAQYNPEMKLLYLMRNPIERIKSHYTHRYLRARTRKPIDQVVLDDPIYVNRSRYHLQLSLYLKRFPVEQIFPIFFEEYVAEPDRILKEVAGFLEISPDGFQGIDLAPQYKSQQREGFKKIKNTLTPLARMFPLKVRNALRGPFVYDFRGEFDLSDETRSILTHLLAADVSGLEILFARKLEIWKDFYPHEQ